MTDNPEDDYGSESHIIALRLVLATLNQDCAACDQIFEEIGECPDCWQRVTSFLASECATAYTGPPEETEDGFRLPPQQVEGAISFISDILADALDARQELI